MPFNTEVTSSRVALPKPEVLAIPLETNVIESIVIDPQGVVFDTSGPYKGRGYMLAGTILSDKGNGRYEEYAAGAAVSAVNEVQTITVDATAGNWNAQFDGETTADVAFNVSAANLKVALAALPNLVAADLTVTGGPGDSGGTTPYVVTFGGQYAATNVSTLVVTDVTLTGGGDATSISANTQGVEGVDADNIAGILFDTVEFADNTPGSQEPAAMLRRNVSFDKSNIQDYATHSAALIAWGDTVNCEFIERGND